MHRCRGDRSQPPIVPRTSDSQPEPSQPRPDLAPRHLQDPYPRGTTAQLPSGLTPAWQYTPTSDPNDPALQANDEPPPPSQALPGSTRRGHRYESPGRHGSPYRHDSSRGATRADRLGDWPQALSTAQPNQSASLSPQPQPVRAIPSAPSGYHQASQQRQPFPVTLTGSLQQLTPTPPGHLPPTPSRGQLPYLPNQRPLRSHDPAQMPTSSSSHHQTPSRPQMSSELLPPPPARRPAAAVQQQQAHNDPALDFFSEHFDALKALQTRGLQPPVPRVKPLDNITRCRMILPPELPDSSSAWAASHPKAEPTQVCTTALHIHTPQSFARLVALLCQVYASALS